MTFLSKQYLLNIFFNNNATHEKNYKLLGIIPGFKIKWSDVENIIIKHYYLLGLIPLFRIKRNNNVNTLTCWLFCIIPLIKLNGLKPKGDIVNECIAATVKEQQIQRLREINILPNTVAVVEMYCHGEVFPSVVNYFLKLGYNVHLFLASDAEETTNYKPLTRARFDIEVFYITKKNFCTVFSESFYFTNYKYIFFPTVFWTLNADNLQDAVCKYTGNNIYYINHDCNPAIGNRLPAQVRTFYNDFSARNRVFSIKPNVKNNPNFAVCTYFGNIKRHAKNKITIFLCAGGVWKSKLRNFDLLLESAKILAKDYQFKLLFAGVSEQDLPQGFYEIKDYIQTTGKTGYTDFYSWVEACDFVLWNIDNTCDDYEKYLYYGTTGNYGLSLGFHKISIIEQKIAQTHNFNEDNALLYTNNLVEVMKKAIEMNDDEYQKMRDGVVQLKSTLEQLSLENMRRVFGQVQL